MLVRILFFLLVSLNFALAQGTYPSPTVNNLTVTGTSIIPYKQSGTGAVSTTVETRLKRQVLVTDFGADPTGVNDSSAACTAALNSFTLTVGGTLIFPAGTYKFNSACDIPAFSGSAMVKFALTGATITTTNAINLFRRLPVSQTSADQTVGTEYIFEGGNLKGSGLTGQIGIFLGANYKSLFIGNHVQNLDVGIDCVFCLGATFINVKATNNLTYGIKLESACAVYDYNTNLCTTLWWTGGSRFNSQSNASTIIGFRNYARAGSTAAIAVLAASDVVIRESVLEGAAPVNNIYFDDLEATVIKNLVIENVHNENLPSNAMFKFKGVGGGVYLIKNIYWGASTNFLDFSELTNGNYVIENIPYTSGLSGKAFVGVPAGTTTFTINQWGPGNADVTDAAWWSNGSAPINLLAHGRQEIGSGYQIYGKRITLGTDNNPGAAYNGLIMSGQVLFTLDNTYTIGKGGSTLARPTDVYVGTGGVYSAGGYKISNLLISGTAPTISSGFGTSPTIVTNGTGAFQVTVGTGGTASSGVISMPAATTGWSCSANDVTSPTVGFLTKQTASTTTSVTITNYDATGVATAWTAGDKLNIMCMAF